MKKRDRKKKIAMLLSIALLGTELFPVTGYAAEDRAAEEAQEQALREELSQNAAEYPNGLFGFHTTQIQGTEGEKLEITVVRQGGTEGEASVSLKAVDVSASYGNDYLMTVKESAFFSRTLEGTGGATLMEQYADSLEVTDGEPGMDVEAEAPVDMETVNQAAGNGVSRTGLAGAKAAQTGVVPVQTAWRELDGSGEEEKAGEILNLGERSVQEMIEEIDGVSCTLDFAKGEYKKVITVELIDDGLSESQEQVMFGLYGASGAELGANDSAWMNILDNDEKEEAVFAMAAEHVTADRAEGEVKLTVKRTAGTEQMSVVTVGTSAVDARPGTDYESMTQELVFPAGMTSKEVSIRLPASDTEKDVSFYVGLSSVSGRVEESAKATLVTVTDRQPDGTLASVTETMEGSEWKDTRNVGANLDVNNSRNGTAGRTLLSGLDLSTASEVRITWQSTGGKYDYKDGCDKKTARGREVSFSINGKVVETKSGDSFDKRTTSINVASKGVQVTGSKVEARVKTTGENRNANLYVEKIEIAYPGYTYTINNDYGYNQKKELVNTTNTYVEKVYTSSGTGGWTPGTVFQLGKGTINEGLSSVTVYRPGDKLNFSWSLNTSAKSSAGTVINGDRVEFKGWQLRKKGSSTTWSDTISSIEFNKSFIQEWKDYIQENNVINVRPVFKVKDAAITFENKETQKGSYKGYGNNTTLSVKRLDTVSVTGVAKTGFAVTGFSVCESGTKLDVCKGKVKEPGKAVTPIATGRKDTIKLAPLHDCTVNMLYTEPTLTVKADKLGDNPDKGSVVYYDPETKQGFSGKKGKDMVIKPASLETLYRMIGVPDPGYLTYWRDGTLDLDDSGTSSEKEKETYKEYTEFSPVSGDVLAYTTKLPFSKIYYDFQPARVVKNPQSIEGRVYLIDKEIFTGKERKKGVNGATVTVSNQSEVTKMNPSSSRLKGGDGYFEVYDDTFSVYGYYLVNISYTGTNGGTINTSYVCNPGSFKPLEIETDEKIWVNSAAAYRVEDGKETAITNLKDINNGDNLFRLKIQTGSLASVIPQKATLRFYSSDGKPVNKTVVDTIGTEDGGWFTLDFNPKNLELAKGTRLTVQFEDSNGNACFERETGISLTEAIGTLDLTNSFAFGGGNTVIKLIGTINSAFHLGWNGDFDKSDAVSTSTDESGRTVKTVSLGFSKDGISKEKELYSLQTAADGKTKADENLAKLKKERAGTKDKDKQKELDEKIGKAQTEKTKADEKYNKAIDTSVSKEKVKTNVGANVNLDVEFKFAMSFALDEEENQWYFSNMMVYAEVKGGANVNVSFATPIGITINLGFGAGGKGSALFVVEERADQSNPKRYYLGTLKDKDEDRINIFNCDLTSDNRAFDGSGTFEVDPYISISAGAGVLGNMVKVSVDGKAQFEMTFFTDERENYGSVNLSASISVKVLGIGGSWPFVSKDVPLFGNTPSALEELESQNYLYDSAEMLQPDERAYLENRGKWNAGDGMESYSIEENGAGLEKTVLQEGLYTHPDIQMVPVGDTGKILAVFLDDHGDRDALNAPALYYTVYDGSKWSEPRILEDDGTLDEAPVISDLGDKGILVAWSTANKAFTEETSRVDMMNALDIHAALFDVSSLSFGDIMAVTRETKEDTVADVNPNISCDGDKLVIYYTKNEYEVSDAASGEVIGDVVHPAVSLMAYRLYDFASGTWREEYSETEKAAILENSGLQGKEAEAYYQNYVANWYGQIFMNTAPAVYIEESLDEQGYWTEEPVIYPGYTVRTGEIHENTVADETTTVSGSQEAVQTEPKIVDSDAITYSGISIFAYVVDYDSNMSTVNDRDVYVQLYDFEEDTFSHPIMVTSDYVEDTNVRFMRLGEGEKAQTYLSWLSDGDIKAMNLSALVKNSETALKKGVTDGGVEYYYINKSADCEAYEPASVMIQGPRDEETENSKSAITGFDVRVNGTYVYFVWTQRAFTLADGVEPDSEEASLAENQKIETQVYASRCDISDGRMTGAIQVTSGKGMNYGDTAFTVDADGGMKVLASAAGTDVKSYEEFRDEIRAYNELAAEEDKVDLPDEEDYTEYAKVNEDQKKLVMLDVSASGGHLALEDVSLENLAAGTANSIAFTMKNEGFGTVENLELTVKDKDGKSLLLKSTTITEGETDTVQDEIVDSIRIDSLYGCDKWQGVAVCTLAEEDTAADYTIQVKTKDGVVIDETFHEEIADNTALTEFEVCPTEERDVFELKGKVENLADRISEANTLAFTMTDPDGQEQKIGEIPVSPIKQGGSFEFDTQVRVDSEKLFVTRRVEKEDQSLEALESTGCFHASVNGSRMTDTYERMVDGGAYRYVESIQEVRINDGSPITVEAGELKRVQANIKSSMADPEDKITGTEGLQVLWATENPDVAEADQAGYIEAKKPGTTELYAYIMPKNSTTRVTDDRVTEKMEYEELPNYNELPGEAIVMYSTTVIVNAKNSGQPVVKQEPKPGEKVMVGEKVYVVTKSDGKAKEVSFAGLDKNSALAKSVAIPATVQIGGSSYQVTGIQAKALGGNKRITSVAVGSNVRTIGKGAFQNCVNLAKVTFKGKKVTKIDSQAFQNCKKLKTFKQNGTALKTIGKAAFKGCKSLTGFIVTKNVTQIGANAFLGCTKLKKVVFMGGRKVKMGSRAFYKTSPKAVFRVPKKRLAYYKKALKKARINKKAIIKRR